MGRVGGLGIAVLSVLALTPGAARADHATARSTDDACAGAAEDGFTDTGPPGSAGEQAVDCIVWYGIAKGTSTRTYAPGATISRGQLATMLAAVMRTSERSFSEAKRDFFGDDDGSVHEDNINFVAEHGVVRGVAPGRFAPEAAVRRDQMASLVKGVIEVVGAPVPTTTHDYFPDDQGNVHESSINRLAALGVVTGRSGGRYEPAGVVTRLQMAFFLTRAADHLVERGRLLRPDQRIDVTLDDNTVEQGSPVTGTLVAGQPVLSVTLDGCGFDGAFVEDRDPTASGIQFSETLGSAQPAGGCTLTFTASLADGSSPSRSVALTVLQAGGEATDGLHSGVEVGTVQRDGNSFTGATDEQGHPTERFDYDANDSFRLGVSAIDLARFERLLTAGDVLDVVYSSNPGGSSLFTVRTDRVPGATNVRARVVMHRDGVVALDWAPSAQPDAVYDVYRDDPVTDNDTIGPEDGAALISDTSATSVQVEREPEGTYNYLVRPQGGTSGATGPAAASNDVTVTLRG